MAELPYTTNFPKMALMNTAIALYQGINNADTTQPWVSGDYADKSVHVYDGAGAGNIVIQGSNDPRVVTDPANAKWVTVKDTTDTDMIFAAGATSTTGGKGTVRDNFYALRVSTTGVVTDGKVAFTGRRTR